MTARPVQQVSLSHHVEACSASYAASVPLLPLSRVLAVQACSWWVASMSRARRLTASMGAAIACTGPTKGRAVLWRSEYHTAIFPSIRCSTVGQFRWACPEPLLSATTFKVPAPPKRQPTPGGCEPSQGRVAACLRIWICLEQWHRVGWLLKPLCACRRILGVHQSDWPNDQAELPVLSTILVIGSGEYERQQNRLQCRACRELSV